MPGSSTIILFASAALVLTASPGPDMLLIAATPSLQRSVWLNS